jgi:DNA-binding PadR family transcriptional regulator
METEKSETTLEDELKRRFVRDFLDIVILQLIKAEPTWGYSIIKKTETMHKVKLRHGALYPMLNKLEAKMLIKSRKEIEKGRVRRIYEITPNGRFLLNAYNDFLKQQLHRTG